MPLTYGAGLVIWTQDINTGMILLVFFVGLSLSSCSLIGFLVSGAVAVCCVRPGISCQKGSTIPTTLLDIATTEVLWWGLDSYTYTFTRIPHTMVL